MKKVNHILIAIMFIEPLSPDFSYFRVTSKFQDKFNRLFEYEEPKVIVPSGQQAPPEVPRYILDTKDNSHSFAFSGIRFDFNFSYTEGFSDKILEQNIIDILNTLKSFELSPFRLGIVIDGLVYDEDSQKFLEKYVSSDIIKNSLEQQISYRDMFEELGHSYNIWNRFSWSKNNINVEFQFDINTLAPMDVSIARKAFNDTMCKKIGEFIGS